MVAVTDLLLRPSSSAEAACSAAKSVPDVRSSGCPSTSHDSFSESDTGGYDVSAMIGTLTVPVTRDAGFDREVLAQGDDVEPGIVERAVEDETPGVDDELLAERAIDAVHGA